MRQLNTKNPHMLKLMGAVVGCAIGVLGNALTSWLQQYSIDKTFAFVVLTSVILSLTITGFFTGAWLERQKLAIPIKKTMYWVLVTLITGTVFLSTMLSWMYARLEPQTTYFLLNDTEAMLPFFEDVRSQLRTINLPNIEIGLSIYGGTASRTNQCDSAKQVIKPSTYANTGKKLDSTLSSIGVHGHGSLISAVFDTLKILDNHEEPIKLVIITSGIDTKCDSLSISNTEEISRRLNINISIDIISIGKLEYYETNILKNYANALHGGYWNINTPTQLAQLIQTDSSYSPQEYDYPYFSITPTPTP